ncbi:MAG: ROK family protein, partial [Atribacterota bacterium]
MPTLKEKRTIEPGNVKMKGSRLSIGIDLGGTKIAGILVNDCLDILAFEKIPVDPERRVEVVLQDIIRLGQSLLDQIPDQKQFSGMGIALPGLLDLERGMMIFSENLNWRNIEVMKYLRERLPVSLYLEHDVRSGAIAETFFGAGREFQDIAYVSVGTGISGTLIWHRNIIRGVRGTSAEIGHTNIEPNGPLCRCGNAGCLEALASGSAMERDAYHLLKEKVRGEVILERAKNHVSPYYEIVKKAAGYLGLALANLAEIFDPQVIILGGGVAEAGDFWLDLVKASYYEHLTGSQQLPDIFLGTFKGKASVMGAAGLPYLKEERAIDQKRAGYS